MRAEFFDPASKTVSVVDNLRKRIQLVQKKPAKYLMPPTGEGVWGVYNREDGHLRGTELLDSIQVKTIAGAKRQRKQQRSKMQTEPIEKRPRNYAYDFAEPRPDYFTTLAPKTLPRPTRIALTSQVKRKQKLVKMDKMTDSHRGARAFKRDIDLAELEALVRSKQTRKPSLKRRKKKYSKVGRAYAGNKYPPFQQRDNLNRLARGNRMPKFNKKKSNMIDLTAEY